MKTRLYVAAVLGGLALVAVLAFAVFQFGRKNPSPPSLIDNPNPEIAGRIVYVDEEGCVIVAEASGASRREVVCPYFTEPYLESGGVTWVDAGHVAFVRLGDRQQWTRVDLATGEEQTVTCAACYWPGPVYEPVSVNGERASVLGNGDVYVGQGSDRTKVFDYNGPDYGWISIATWSPDGEWLALLYPEKGEVWIVRRDGSFKGTVITDMGEGYARGVSWWIDGYGYLPESSLPVFPEQ